MRAGAKDVFPRNRNCIYTVPGVSTGVVGGNVSVPGYGNLVMGKE